MATIYHFPIFHSLSSNKLFSSSAPLPLQNSHIHHCHHNRVVTSSFNKPPPRRRKTKTNEELCSDIRDFLSAVGLPENHVPSMSELSQNGRQDLANIVRRRGYKLIRQLLQTSSTGITDTSQTEEVLSGSEAESGQNVKLDFLPGDVLSSEAIQEGYVNGCTETDEQLNLNDQSYSPPKSITLSLQEKVAKFIQLGELDTAEELQSMINEMNYFLDSEGGLGVEYNLHADEAEADSAFSHQQQKEIFSSSRRAETLNGSVSSFEKVEDPVLGNSSSRSSDISAEEHILNDSDKDLNIENKQNVESQAEIKHLKFLLHQKELELTQLKQQIEKEKLALSILQTKAETEISKAQRLISEKDAELRGAEESLSGLKEVEIQYSGDGDTVELAGSFNGWNHKIKMEPVSSFIMNPTGPSTSRLWRAMLWLYPGVYEVKFVIDGHWIIDPQRESIIRHGVHNNILRVDR